MPDKYKNTDRMKNPSVYQGFGCFKLFSLSFNPNCIGAVYSFSNRAKLAAQYGIHNYKGTAKQNLDLLNKLRAGKSVTAEQPATKKAIKRQNQ
ncbi:hypothetical protein J22TS1_32410 [Siminovitchia terrae]|nr:hypothetical protein J22TS1_32410 [Siminovitchia terrae]